MSFKLPKVIIGAKSINIAGLEINYKTKVVKDTLIHGLAKGVNTLKKIGKVK